MKQTTTLDEAFEPAKEEGTPARELLLPGKYKAEVVRAFIVGTKNGKGQMLNLGYAITEGEYEKRIVFQSIIVQHESMDAQRFGRQKVKDLCVATDVTDTVSDVEVFLYKPVVLTLGIEKDKTGQYPDKNKVTSVKPVTSWNGKLPDKVMVPEHEARARRYERIHSFLAMRHGWLWEADSEAKELARIDTCALTTLCRVGEVFMCYDDVAPLYEARGYHPLPVDPKDKFPVYLKADGTYGKAAGWTTEKVPLRAQGKANIGIRTGTDIGVVGVDVDSDDPDIQAALPAMVRDSLVKKKGQRGYTSFLFGPGVKSRKFLIDGKTVVEILGVGRQTVIPPSVHPVTQKPYEWVGDGFELLDVEPARDLTHVPPDFERLIEEALRPFGFRDEAPKPETSTLKSDDEKPPHRQLNELACANLQKWVPHLGLERYRRKRGPHLAFEAVATWRPSSQGRALPARDYNLNITAKSGITDFGDGRSYTPLDLVMAARTLNLSDAFVWLDDKLGWSSNGPEIVIPGPWEGSDKNARPEKPEAEETDRQRLKPRPPAGTGAAWHFGTPAPALPPMLVPGLLPRKGYGYIGGQWGTLKTFITNDLAVAVATGGRFAGQQVTMKGAVVQIELEGSHSELRLHAAADARGVGQGELPIVHLRAAPQTIMNNGKPNPEWPKWSKDLVRYAKEIAEFYELPLALITLDPQNRLAGFKDEQS